MQVGRLLLTLLAALNQVHPLLGYTAAVLEYYPLTSDTPKTTILLNLNEYRDFASKAKAKGADIIVFPEYGLTTLAKNPRKYATEVNPYSDVLNRLRFMASELQMYIVVNLLEVFQPSLCCGTPRYYNTNLVFDRNGSLILSYRKINLCNEDHLDPGSRNQTATFTTDFGVTFAIFTSHDILFDSPARAVLKKGLVTDAVYPTAWASTLPFYTSLTIQYGYFVSSGINLLASSYNQPLQHRSGSGVYTSQKIKTYLTDSPSSKLIVMAVQPQNTEKESCSNFDFEPYCLYSRIGTKNWTSYFDSSVYSIKNVRSGNSSAEICYGNFCCTFHIAVGRGLSSESFKVVAFDGSVLMNRQEMQVRICSLLACGNGSGDSCGEKSPTSTRFSRIAVTTNADDDVAFYMPLTLNFRLQPLGKISFCRYNDSPAITLRSENVEELLVFGLFAHRDSANANESALTYSLSLLLLGMEIKLLCI